MKWLYAVVMAVSLSVSSYMALKVYTLTSALVVAQSSLERRTEALETSAKTYALSSDIRVMKDDVSLLLAQSTLAIQDVAQANIHSLTEIKKELNDETKTTGKDVNALHPSVARFLREYEASRSGTH